MGLLYHGSPALSEVLTQVSSWDHILDEFFPCIMTASLTSSSFDGSAEITGIALPIGKPTKESWSQEDFYKRDGKGATLPLAFEIDGRTTSCCYLDAMCLEWTCSLKTHMLEPTIHSDSVLGGDLGDKITLWVFSHQVQGQCSRKEVEGSAVTSFVFLSSPMWGHDQKALP